MIKSILKFTLDLIPKKYIIKLYQIIGNNADLKIKRHNIWFDAKEWSPMYRGITLMEGEAGTIKWIDRYINEEDVVYDIGANIGIFSLYIAKFKGANVYAFEPESQNYSILNRNIYHNDLQDKIEAYNIACCLY